MFDTIHASFRRSTNSKHLFVSSRTAELALQCAKQKQGDKQIQTQVGQHIGIKIRLLMMSKRGHQNTPFQSQIRQI